MEGFKEGVVVKFKLIFSHPCFYVVGACIEFFDEVGHFSLEERISGAEYYPRKADDL